MEGIKHGPDRCIEERIGDHFQKVPPWKSKKSPCPGHPCVPGFFSWKGTSQFNTRIEDNHADIRGTMKRNLFFLCIAIVAFIEVGIFWVSVDIVDPLPSVIAIILGIIGIYLARMHIDEVIEDERTKKITEITALRTLQITWVGLFLLALWIIIEALGEGFRHYNRQIGIMGFRLLIVLCGIIALYVVLSLYYNRKFGV